MIEPILCKSCTGQGNCDLESQWSIFGESDSVNDSCEAYIPTKDTPNAREKLEQNLKVCGLPKSFIKSSLEMWDKKYLESKTQ